MTATMLIVEDDQSLRETLEKSFKKRGHSVLGASRVDQAIGILRSRVIDVMLLDHQLPDGSGLEVLAEVNEHGDNMPVIMMTAFPEVKTAVRAMKAGARDFIEKPFDLDELHLAVARALADRDLRRTVQRLEHEGKSRGDVTEMVGESPALRAMRDDIAKVAEMDTAVLVVGETGTGKELVADSVHRLSHRSDRALVKVNCSAFAPQLLESELFGHEKGAFTDARSAREGLFEMAAGGTLFLDEISELRLDLQAKLLRIVEGHPFHRLGGTREIQPDVRLVAATNRSLKARVEEGLFRADLYYRLNVFEISVPALRERESDAALLADFFLRRWSKALRKGELRLSDQVREQLLRYDWPGNVRELRNIMERAAILCDAEVIEVEHLPLELKSSTYTQRPWTGPQSMPTLQNIEQEYIEHVVKSADGNLSEAARVLGIARNTLKAKLRGGASPDKPAEDVPPDSH